MNRVSKILSNLDFTAQKYEKLCQAIVSSSYTPVTLARYLELGTEKNRAQFIILRHDIDRTPGRALEIAKLENKYGIPATYYFRDPVTNVPQIMDEIAALKHEIGFHYENIDKCKGNVRDACLLFEKELAGFRKRYDIKTICAHGNPLTRWDNKQIWKTIRLSEFGLLGEAFLSLDYDRFAYLSDSGRTWLNNQSQKMPGKDSVQTAFDDIKTRNTDDVIGHVRDGKLPNICILTHPERWCGDIIGFTGRYLLDIAFSGGKVLIHTYRKAVKNEIALHH